MYRKTYVEVNTKIIENNIKSIINKYNNYKYYIGVVKGNAYGHGMEVCKWIIKSGINYLAVSTLDEAMEIREKVSKTIPILILQPVDLEYIDVCSKNKITITISSFDYYQKLIKKEIKNLKIHLKIDSGMNRLGINNEEEINQIYNELINSKMIKLEGIYTHLATIGVIDNRFDKQIDKFKELTKNIDLTKIEIVHIFSSNAFAIHPKLRWANGVRLGIIMYGLSPRNFSTLGFKNQLRKLRREYKRKTLRLSPINTDFHIDVRPALKLVSEVCEIKEVEDSEYIGYGSNYLTDNECKIAIVPVGYMDGLSLLHKGRSVFINNNRYPIVGVINMGMITVKIDNSVKLNDRVEVIKEIRSEASYASTTPHQLLASISKSLDRKYISKEDD